MKEKSYYKEIKDVIEELEGNNFLRVQNENNEKVESYWQIGKILVDAQGGKEKAKYGNELIKKWSQEFTNKYGKSYSATSLKYYRQFYMVFPNGPALRGQLSWAYYKLVLPIKNELERMFYLNEAISKNLSSRELEKLIKNKVFADCEDYENKELNIKSTSNELEENETHDEKYYFNEINDIIASLEANNTVRKLKAENEKIEGYWKIGSLIIKAQGGNDRSKYGDNLIKKWAITLENKFGKKYSRTNLFYMRQFYLLFPKWEMVCNNLTWTHYKLILPIKSEFERNYYINQVILNNLSTRELENEIKNKAYERLISNTKENIKIITNSNDTLSIGDMIKDPIIIRSNKKNINELALHKYIIDMVENRFLELGLKFALMGHEYKIRVDNHTYRIDLLFFNVKLNCYVVFELKIGNMKVKDIDELKFYIDLVDKNVKEDYNNPTIGVLVCKEYDKFTIKYASDKEIFATKYKLEDKNK